MLAKPLLLAAIVWLGTALMSSAAQAQTYPDKPIRVILPFTAGSPNDVVARVVAPHLSSRLRQPVVIENRPGGSTSIGVKAVLAADPDGYTLLHSNSPTHFLASLVNENFTYNPLKDFVPIATVGYAALVLVVTPDVPAKSLAEFVAYSKANPGKLNVGFGRGTLPNLVSEHFKIVTGANVTMIPYRGGAQAVADMLGGRIQMNLGAGATLLPLIRDGRLRALAVTSPTRSPDLPDVPTMIESGYPAVAGTNYYGVLGPAGIPAEAVNRVNSAVNESLKSPELLASLKQIGIEPMPGAPQEFARLLASELQMWAPIVKSTGFQLE
jgi:tripartite-type tricarboxylate transporter receptor subunit TctC